MKRYGDKIVIAQMQEALLNSDNRHREPKLKEDGRGRWEEEEEEE